MSTSPRKPIKAARSSAPFFILGCVRSGTTMLRDVLRLHPNLACPEETHFFRWADPFGTTANTRAMSNNPVLKKHREIDGITEDEFAKMLASCSSRADLCERYMQLYIKRKKPDATRWFDKTPQNVYGAMLAATTSRKSRFVHIVRNPLNVVASLRIGKVMSVEQLVGACNYWREAVAIIGGLKRAYPNRVHELRYEDFMQDAAGETAKLLEFVGEPYQAEWFASVKVSESDHQQSAVLTPDEAQHIRTLCASGMLRYGYHDGVVAGDGDTGDGTD